MEPESIVLRAMSNSTQSCSRWLAQVATIATAGAAGIAGQIGVPIAVAVVVVVELQRRRIILEDSQM